MTRTYSGVQSEKKYLLPFQKKEKKYLLDPKSIPGSIVVHPIVSQVVTICLQFQKTISDEFLLEERRGSHHIIIPHAVVETNLQNNEV